jgi:hypothetical protein
VLCCVVLCSAVWYCVVFSGYRRSLTMTDEGASEHCAQENIGLKRGRNGKRENCMIRIFTLCRPAFRLVLLRRRRKG